MKGNRRRHFFINKPLQLRYMLSVTVPLLLICCVAIFGFYIGIWGSVLGAFTNEAMRDDLLTASRMVEYEQARYQTAHEGFSLLSLFKETEKLGQRQREVFHEILNETNRAIAWKLLLLLVLTAWGTIYVSHKIAGPLYRFSKTFSDVERGNYRTRIFLRKGDEGHPVAKEFNAAIESADRLLSDLKTAAQNPDQAQALATIKAKLDPIKTSADV
ncbi:MAG: hypothetical protein BWY44_01223 [Candidatus Omnitrophica bacterium ADurb.Bin292]|jgi:methyl-accepting chemotaxis protein|nr:MAG: hypothetical protein BWY44_01223 [Candidatus Omnitrophica bacterium ADurb.Bin292]HOG23771.1 hypothetical protein [Candidatus Omnitrophota bacterium]HPW77072.1 hypothetical protein [Candidatus Omnitrophota bacterium]HQB12373.1 hypothetical protein [Candidatus Omnitrophota bacterium]